MIEWLRGDREDAFTHVADVQALLEDVFERTNEHGEGAWTENKEVIWHLDVPLRSTSVGDVICERETQRVWLVAVASLEEFPPPQLEAPLE